MNIDWSKAPEGATHFRPAQGPRESSLWVRMVDGIVLEVGYPEKGWTTRYDRNGQPGTDMSCAIARPVTMCGITSFAAKAEPWDGSGLPPVGLEIEVLWDSEPPQYVAAKIVGQDDGRAVYRLTSGNRKGEYGSDVEFYNKIPNFRPIRTPEQIAAEDRESCIVRMTNDAGNASDLARRVYADLYDAGYRKIKIVEGE